MIYLDTPYPIAIYLLHVRDYLLAPLNGGATLEEAIEYADYTLGNTMSPEALAASQDLARSRLSLLVPALRVMESNARAHSSRT